MKDGNRKNQSVKTLETQSLDAAIAAPEYHKIVFENERVRVRRSERSFRPRSRTIGNARDEVGNLHRQSASLF